MAVLVFNPGACDASPALKISSNMTKDCYGVSQYGCYVANTKTIVIAANTAPGNVEYLYLHEYGHYLTLDMPEAKLRAVFGGKTKYETYEKAASGFYWHASKLKWSETKEKAEFWNKLFDRKS